MSAPFTSFGGAKSTADAVADIQRVVERKRAEADKTRYELNESLKELYELQSQVMALERENEIVGRQLQRPAFDPGAVRPNQTYDGSARLLRDEGGGVISTVTAAIYATDEIKAKSDELARIKNETLDAEFRGKMFRHMKDRLAAQVVGAKRDCSKLQARLHDARAANQELHRKEGEVERQLAMARARLTETKKHVDTQNAALKRDLVEQRASLQHKIESNKFLDAQIADARAGRAKAIVLDPLGGLGTSDAAMAAAVAEAAETEAAAALRRAKDAAGIFSSRGAQGRITQAIGSLESEEAVFVDALRHLGLPVPKGLLPADDPTHAPGSPARGGATHIPAGHSRAAAAIGGEDDVNFLVRACVQQDEVRISLLQKQAAEEARISALQAQLHQLRGVGNGGADSISQALATAVARNAAALSGEGDDDDAGGAGSPLASRGAGGRRRSLLQPLFEEEPDEPSPSTGNRCGREGVRARRTRRAATLVARPPARAQSHRQARGAPRRREQAPLPGALGERVPARGSHARPYRARGHEPQGARGAAVGRRRGEARPPPRGRTLSRPPALRRRRSSSGWRLRWRTRRTRAT